MTGLSLALANLKPGTGKTTSAVWLAHVFAQAGNAVLLVAATGCRVAKAGTRCRTTEWGRDSGHVLQCKAGRWRRVMTFGQAAHVIAQINGRDIHTIMDFYKALNDKARKYVSFKIRRQGMDVTIGLTR